MKLIKSAIVLLMLSPFLITGFSEPLPDYHDRQRIVASDDILLIQARTLDQPTMDQIATLDARPQTKELWLVDVPGGDWVQTARLAWRAQLLEVYVSGACISGCARIALAGKSLTLVVDTRNEKRTVLGIHGTFSPLLTPEDLVPP